MLIKSISSGMHPSIAYCLSILSVRKSIFHHRQGPGDESEAMTSKSWVIKTNQPNELDVPCQWADSWKESTPFDSNSNACSAVKKKKNFKKTHRVHTTNKTRTSLTFQLTFFCVKIHPVMSNSITHTQRHTNTRKYHPPLNQSHV